MIPTDEQVKEFWEGIFGKGGVEFSTVVNGEIVCYRRTTWNTGNEEWNIEVIPRMDSMEFLGYLFKHAVPKICNMGLAIYLASYVDPNDVVDVTPKSEAKVYYPLSGNAVAARSNNIDPALALFWALYPLITGKEIHE